MALPQVVSLGALDTVNFGPIDTVPSRFTDRNLYRHNAAVTLLLNDPAFERAMAGRLTRRTGRGSSRRWPHRQQEVHEARRIRHAPTDVRNQDEPEHSSPGGRRQHPGA